MLNVLYKFFMLENWKWWLCKYIYRQLYIIQLWISQIAEFILSLRVLTCTCKYPMKSVIIKVYFYCIHYLEQLKNLLWCTLDIFTFFKNHFAANEYQIYFMLHCTIWFEFRIIYLSDMEIKHSLLQVYIFALKVIRKILYLNLTILLRCIIIWLLIIAILLLTERPHIPLIGIHGDINHNPQQIGDQSKLRFILVF